MQTHSDDECLGPHGVASVGLSSLAHDLYSSEITSQSASSQATTILGDQPTIRPPGVKESKGDSGKRTIVDQQAVSEFQGMWFIKEKDLAAKERLK
ncbi:hypothetical protein F2Q68_00045344 [Brassica cretica]|nr:hypothetical protein F2Q68_00045344 [Brassica cretica]